MFAFARVRRRWAAGAFVLGLVAVVIVACGDDDPTPVPTRAPTAQPTATATTAPQPTEPAAMMEVMEESKAGSVVIALGELNDSGQSGKATLTARGDRTEVVIEIAAGAAGVAQPIHIHEGTCDTLGGVSFALTNLDGGKSTTTVDATLASLRSGKFAINGHKSGDEIGTYIACGSIPQTQVVTLTELNGSGQNGTATLTTRGDETEVVIDIAVGAAGVAQPIHIHEGTCDTLGGVSFALTSLADGKSTTIVPTTLTSLHAGKFAINGHKSGDEIATYISCGDISADGAMMQVMEASTVDSAVIALGELNDSGQSGKATLTARGDRTEVVIEIAAGAAGVAQPIHIHEGTCDTLGGVSFALTNLDGGKSTTTVDATLASLRSGKFAINGHKSGDEIGTYIACGSIPQTQVVTLTELNGSGQNGTATLTTRGDETEVVIDIAVGAAGVAQPIHIHEGTCDTLGGVSFALTSLADGKSTTIVPTTLTSLHAGKFAINGHKSGDEIATYISCGDISADGAMMMEDGDAMEAEATDTPSGGETVASDIRNFQLENLNIKVGTTVVWTQQDSTTHTATSGTPPNGDGTWDTGFLMEGESGDGVVFDRVGTFVYFCRVHNSMTGTVTVTE